MIKMDNFDEHDEKLFIEISVDRDVFNAACATYFPAVTRANETTTDVFENLLQAKNSKLVLQAKNPYTKLAFIKTLKDNLVCLGYLEETTDTLNFFNEDLINTTINSSLFVKKQRKNLVRNKTNIFSNETYEVDFLF